MTITEILPTLKALNHKDKIRVIQFLANEIAKEEEVFFEEGGNYKVWSPYDSYEAAEQLRNLLEGKEGVNV